MSRFLRYVYTSTLDINKWLNLYSIGCVYEKKHAHFFSDKVYKHTSIECCAVVKAPLYYDVVRTLEGPCLDKQRSSNRDLTFASMRWTTKKVKEPHRIIKLGQKKEIYSIDLSLFFTFLWGIHICSRRRWRRATETEAGYLVGLLGFVRTIKWPARGIIQNDLLGGGGGDKVISERDSRAGKLIHHTGSCVAAAAWRRRAAIAAAAGVVCV